MPIENLPSGKGLRISDVHDIGAGADLSAVSLLFAPGDRPGVEQVRALSVSDRTFAISLAPQADAATASGQTPGMRWLELLSNGLTFDLEGLMPGEPSPLPSRAHTYGLSPEIAATPLQAICLRPGPHIAAGARMMPVLRSLALLAAHLAALPQVRAVAWHAARAWSAPTHFRESVIRWVEGGAFPGLGLTALAPTPEGGLQSEGLALFIGQELRVDPTLAFDRGEAARLALRLLHWLVENGRLEGRAELAGPAGEPLVLEPSTNGRFVGVWRG